MGYRDELTAAQAQIERLAAELEDARRENAELREGLSIAASAIGAREERESAAAMVRPAPRAIALVGSLHYDPPLTYFPLVSHLRYVAPLALRNPPRLAELDSNSLLDVIWHWGFAWPFVTLLWRPVYRVSLFVMLPWFALLAGVGSIFLLPVVALRRLRVGPREPENGTRWPERIDRDGATTFFFVVLLTMPFLLPVFATFWLSLMTGELEDA